MNAEKQSVNRWIYLKDNISAKSLRRKGIESPLFSPVVSGYTIVGMATAHPEKNAKKKICIVSSCGGHLAEVRLLRSLYEPHEFFYVLNDRIILPPDMEGKTYFASLFERDLRFFVNLGEAWKILRAEKPDLMLSTGAGIIVPFAICAKLLGIPVVFVETVCRVDHPSLTGKLMYRLADKFFYQWEALGRYFPKGEYCGPIV